ncbi:hypothetical protein H6P81_005475 [Aristolochia fimbriata]|uniref:Uncharacterized protein n=1 Tax=Aristolochia fimbriata TaxID=158543 RepID=A0AAV7EVN3_ARIFI|nr:hypothetical protein H6P81_005475 [Aristolochia fimbriata]
MNELLFLNLYQFQAEEAAKQSRVENLERRQQENLERPPQSVPDSLISFQLSFSDASQLEPEILEFIPIKRLLQPCGRLLWSYLLLITVLC